jgi:hypothetical protein
MKKLLPSLLLLFVQGYAEAQGPAARVSLKETIKDFPRFQLELKTNGPVSVDVNQGTGAAYRTLAEMAGLNIVFDPDFRDISIAPFRIENADVLQAFDLLSMRSGCFVEVVNSKTIIVAPDNPTKHRDYELEVLKTFYLPNGTTPQALSEIVTTLRTTLQLRYLATSSTANAIVLRDTPNRIALAEKTIALAGRIVAGDPAANNGEVIPGGNPIFTLEAGAVRKSRPARSALKPSAPGPVSLDLKDNTRAIFETLARSTGLNIVFERDFRSQDVQSFKVENMDVFDAIDVLALQTRTFWEVLDSKTIIVAPDNQTKRRELENTLIKTFYLPNASQTELTEVITAIRTLLNARYLAQSRTANAIVMRDTANRLTFAERIISDLRKPGGVTSPAAISTGTENGFILNRRVARTLTSSPSPLPSRIKGTFSFDMNDSAKASYEAVAAMAGLRVVFDDRFQDGAAAPFKLQNVDILDALDFLSLQTGNIWQVMDGDTIVVAPDNPTVRRDRVPGVTKTINLSKAEPVATIEIVTALRTLLNARQISTIQNSIVMQDTAESIAFAEKIVSDLDRPEPR